MLDYRRAGIPHPRLNLTLLNRYNKHLFKPTKYGHFGKTISKKSGPARALRKDRSYNVRKIMSNKSKLTLFLSSKNHKTLVCSLEVH